MMTRAVREVRLPRDCVFYSLRHFYVSKAVAAGVNTLILARNTGTSTKMIETTYAKFLPTDVRQLMDRVQLGLTR